MGIELAVIGTVLGVVGTAVSTSLGIASGVAAHKQAQANADAQAAQAAYNAKLEENEAARIEAETAEEARRMHEEAEKMKARQRALFGKSGAVITSGTPLAVLGESAADLQQSINDTHRAGYLQSAGHKQQSEIYKYHGRLADASRPSSSSLAVGIGGQLASGTADAGRSLLSLGNSWDKLSTKK